MRSRDLLTATLAALAALSVPASAQTRPVSGARITLPSHSNHFSWEGKHGGFHGFGGGVWIVGREVPVIIEKEATPPPPAAVPLPEQAQGGAKASPRKPYVIGSTYAALPGGCMKLIDDGDSYYYCDGEWYRQLGGGRDGPYRAVARP